MREGELPDVISVVDDDELGDVRAPRSSGFSHRALGIGRRLPEESPDMAYVMPAAGRLDVHLSGRHCDLQGSLAVAAKQAGNIGFDRSARVWFAT